jgi:hypothetical protein
MKNFVQPGDVVTVTALASGDVGRLDRGNLAGARSDRHGDEGGRHLDRAGCLEGVAVMAAGA